MTNKTGIFNKLIIWLSIALVVILVGVSLLIVNKTQTGSFFKVDNELATSYTFEVNHDGKVVLNDETCDNFIKLCKEKISNAKLDVITSYKTESSQYTGAKIIFEISNKNGTKTLSPDEMYSRLNEAKTSLESAIDVNVHGNCVVSVHEGVAEVNYDFLWRGAISYGILIVIMFVYLCIRYNLAMALSSLFSNLISVCMTCSLALLCFVQLTSTFVAVVMFASVLTLLFNLVIFNPVRYAMKQEENKKTACIDVLNSEVKADGIALKSVFAYPILASLLLVVISASALRYAFITPILATVVSVFVGYFISPSMMVFFKNRIKSKEKPQKQPKTKKVATQTTEENAENAQ